jgi:hypothetical protein
VKHVPNSPKRNAPLKGYDHLYLFYYSIESIQILVSLRYEYFVNTLKKKKNCVLVEISWPEGLQIARLHDLKMERSTIVGDIFFYYWTELIQILTSLRYWVYTLQITFFFFKRYCVLVEISWPEGLRIARLHDLKMEIQTYVFFLLLNRIESKFGQFEIWIYIV